MTRANTRVRPATSDDIPALVRLARNGNPNSRPADGHDPLADRFVSVIDAPDRTVLVAVDEHGDVAGVLVTRVDEVGSYELTPVLHVMHLMVEPKQRRRGTGRALLSAAVHLAEDAGVENILSTSPAGSREGNRYLARIGFAPLTVHRIAPVSTLRRTLGLTDDAGRLAVLRRARLARAQRTGFRGATVTRRA